MNNVHPPTLRLTMLVACATIALSACGPPGPGLELQLTVLHKDLSLRGAPTAPGAVPAGIDAFRLCVKTLDGRPEICRDFADLNAGSYRIEGLPVGNHWDVTFQGFRAEDRAAIWCGRARDIKIADDQTTPVRMLLTRCGQFTQTIEQPGLGRTFHSATVRPDGRVLLAGGYGEQASSADCDRPCQSLWATASVEIYDHHAGSFGEASFELAHPRGLHAALGLADGRMLLAGGCEVASLQADFNHPERPGSPLRCLVPGQAATTAELYDPASGTVAEVQIPPTLFAAAVPLAGDELLLLGGQDEAGVALRRVLSLKVEGDQIQVQIIEQALVEARRSAAAVLFSRPGDSPAEVLLVGGSPAPDRSEPGPFAERLVYQGGSLASEVPSYVEEVFGGGLPVMHASGARSGPGQVVVSGGMYPARFLSQDLPFRPEPLTAAAHFDLRSDRLRLLDSSNELLEPRAFHTSTAVDRTGHVAVIGGLNSRDALALIRFRVSNGIEWWDPAANYFSLRWAEGAPVEMEVARAGHTASLLADGTLLIVGGMGADAIHASAELFNPAPATLQPDGLPPL